MCRSIFLLIFSFLAIVTILVLQEAFPEIMARVILATVFVVAIRKATQYSRTRKTIVAIICTMISIVIAYHFVKML